MLLWKYVKWVTLESDQEIKWDKEPFSNQNNDSETIVIRFQDPCFPYCTRSLFLLRREKASHGAAAAVVLASKWKRYSNVIARDLSPPLDSQHSHTTCSFWNLDFCTNKVSTQNMSITFEIDDKRSEVSITQTLCYKKMYAFVPDFHSHFRKWRYRVQELYLYRVEKGPREE